MARIEKKTWPEYFEQVLSGEKTYDLRLADFEVNAGDTLVLQEWDPTEETYTGREIEREISHVLKTDILPFWDCTEIDKCGYQILSFKQDLPEVAEIKKMKIESNETLIFKYPHGLSLHAIARMQASVQKLFPGINFVFLEKGMGISKKGK